MKLYNIINNIVNNPRKSREIIKVLKDELGDRVLIAENGDLKIVELLK